MSETPNPVLELALRNAREHRDDMARWLALEVLMNDPLACEDEALQEHLILLQDKVEAKLRASALRVRAPGMTLAGPEQNAGRRGNHAGW